MSGSRSRRKGAAFERRICSVISEAIGCVVKRRLGAARDGGDDTPDGLESWAHSFELKNHKRLQLKEWIKQAKENCEGKVPVVVYHLHGTSEDWAALPLAELLRLVKESRDGKD